MTYGWRDALWRWCCRHHPTGRLLSRRLLCVRAVLFPLDCFYWRLSLARGYQIESDTWLIHGVRYSDRMFGMLARSAGEAYRIRRQGNDVVQIDRMSEPAIDSLWVSQMLLRDDLTQFRRLATKERDIVKTVDGQWVGVCSALAMCLDHIDAQARRRPVTEVSQDDDATHG